MQMFLRTAFREAGDDTYKIQQLYGKVFQKCGGFPSTEGKINLDQTKDELLEEINKPTWNKRSILGKLLKGLQPKLYKAPQTAGNSDFSVQELSTWGVDETHGCYAGSWCDKQGISCRCA